jgi:hypothetical protein
MMSIVFGKEEKLAILLLIAVTAASGTIFLLLDSAGKESFASPYGPSADTGDLVFYEGDVDEIIYTRTGGHIIVKSGNNTIFIRNGAVQEISGEPGLMIHAVGTVENYEGEREIYVSDPSGALFFSKELST